MGREATITYEQIAAVADAMKVEGLKPTSRAVRERAGGTGSMGTITPRLYLGLTASAGAAALPTPTSAPLRTQRVTVSRTFAADVASAVDASQTLERQSVAVRPASTIGRGDVRRALLFP